MYDFNSFSTSESALFHRSNNFNIYRMAMASNVAFALRSIMKKNLPKDFKVRGNKVKPQRILNI